MINLGRAVGLFNRYSPKISKGIGQVANIARNVGQVVKNVRNIGSTVNDISGGRIGSSPIGQKMQEITNKIESGANYISGNEDKAQNALSTISRKING
jgi:phage-related minor tail protein